MGSHILEPEQEMRLQRCSVWWEWTVISILTLHRSTELEIEQETGNTETQQLCVSARLSLNVWQKRENPAFARSLTSAALKAGTKNPAMRPISSSIKSWESGPRHPRYLRHSLSLFGHHRQHWWADTFTPDLWLHPLHPSLGQVFHTYLYQDTPDWYKILTPHLLYPGKVTPWNIKSGPLPWLLTKYVPGHYSHIFNIHDDLHRCGALHGRLLSILKVDKYFLSFTPNFLYFFSLSLSLSGFQSQQRSTSHVSRRSVCLSTSFPWSSSQ